MGVHRLLSGVLWLSLLGSPGAIAQPTPPRLIAQVDPIQAPAATSSNDEALAIDALKAAEEGFLALGLLTGAIALCIGIYQYGRNAAWNRIEFLRKAVKEFEGDPEIWKALKILDFEEYRDYEMTQGEKKITFRVTNDLLYAALANHDERLAQSKTIEALKAANQLDEATLEQYQITTALRDWFNKMLNGLEHFGYFVESGLFTPEEIRPWMIYWIRLIADRTYRRPDSSKVYDYLYSYIHNYGFSGVIKLFERFGYRILPTPYQDKDFQDLSQGLKGFDLKTALSLAKASQLIYQDFSYVTEIARRWGITDIANNFHYIDNREFDTQAFLFKTEDYIVLAFRGSQERKDWDTNFRTGLQKFALRTQMEPLDEDVTPPRGQVHRGFQLAWNSVEDKVIRQIRQWNAGRAVQLPLLITGHSLGGALATVATASLVKRNFRIQGLYTFGQPRVGDLEFVLDIGASTKGKVFRFVNNNDIVPHIPPPYLLWNPFRIYIHMGALYYFTAGGNLILNPSRLMRPIDFSIGLLRSLSKPGMDIVTDHCMEDYINNLIKALDAKREKEKLEKDEAVG